jgi:superfamily I DNA/RNA helicase
MLDPVMAAIRLSSKAEPATPLPVVIGRLRTGREGAGASDAGAADAYDALLGWAPRFADAAALATGVREQRERLGRLRRDDALLTLATAHAVKGLEFDHVIVLQDADRFPSRRALDEAADPARALEEERRLAYVAWTRARRSLTLLYDPAAPSQFLLEAFDRAELGLR